MDVLERLNKVIEPSPHTEDLVRLLAQELQTYEDCTQRIKQDGLMIKTTYTSKAHPLLSIRSNAAKTAMGLADRLGLSKKQATELVVGTELKEFRRG